MLGVMRIPARQVGAIPLVVVLTVGMGVGAVAASRSSSSVTGAVSKPGSAALTATGAQAPAPASNMLTAQGVLAAATTTNLGFRTGDNLKKINVKVGDTVHKGELLAEEDNDSLRDALARRSRRWPVNRPSWR